MAQGSVKVKAKAKVPTRPTGPQRGNRVIKPKKNKLIQQTKIKHKAASGLVAKTEKTLGDKAGHLELLRGGKNTKSGSVGDKGKK